MPSLLNLSTLSGWKQRTQGTEDGRIWDLEPSHRGWTNTFLLLNRISEVVSVRDGLMAANSSLSSYPHCTTIWPCCAFREEKLFPLYILFTNWKKTLFFHSLLRSHQCFASDTRCVCCSPHRATLLFSVDTNSVLYNSVKCWNSTQSWHQVPQVTGSAPGDCLNLRCRSPVQVVICACDSVQFSSVAQSCPTLRPHESQHARPPCPSQTPAVYSHSCPSSRWCHPAISSSVVPFSSCPQSLPASGSFPMSQLFAWGGQSIGVSTSTSVLPMNTQDWSLGWTGWIALQSKGLSRVFSNTTVQKHQFFGSQLSSQSNSHIHAWPLEKTIALTR